MIEVLRPGPLTTVQDAGRPGFAHLGVPHSGAADLPALRAANALAGNPPDAAALETTLSGPALRFSAPAVIALAGAPVRVRVDGEPVAFGEPREVGAGSTLEIGTAKAGLRSYLAVRGGIDVPAVLGSRSADTLTGLGPAPLRAGDVLATGDLRGSGDPLSAALAEPPGDVATLRVTMGPRDSMFSRDAADQLTDIEYEVAPESSRVGVRLLGTGFQRREAAELLSEGLVRGALQVPGSGMPIVMLADHPTTGGYPVIAVVASEHLPLLGQLRPGRRVRFALAQPNEGESR